jgi:PKD repeat protein
MRRRGDTGGENTGVSEVIGTLILVAVVMIGIAIVGLFLISSQPATKVPRLDLIISNRSSTIYILHRGGDALLAGEYQILVDGVDRTSSFANDGNEPWSVGETLSYTSPTMPQKVVILFLGYGGGGTGTGGMSVLSDSTLRPVISPPLHLPIPPTMDWFNSPAFGNISTAIQFTDMSWGYVITSYFWNFNDASTSTEQFPAHTFACSSPTDSCVYSINHSVTDSGGTLWEAVTWVNRSSWVTVYENLTPTISFTQNRTFGPIGCHAIKFNATQAGGIRVDNWSWSFGDGGTSYLEDPTYIYSTRGTYTVSLIAMNYTLGTTSVTASNLIQVTSAWYPGCMWLYRKNITLNRTAVPADLSNFPVLINYLDSDLKARAKAKGADILFTDSTGTTKIPHQIESFMTNTGSLTAWVKVPTLSSSANTTIYLYYGNPASTGQEDSENVWDGNFAGVYHLNESTSETVQDSTSNNRDGTQSQSPVQTAGKINGSLSFDGNNQRVSMGDVAAYDFGTNPFTVSAWVKGGAANDQILGKSNWAGSDNGIQIYSGPEGNYTTAPRGTIGLTGTGGTGYPAYEAGTTSIVNLNNSAKRYYVNWTRQTGTIKGTVKSIDFYIQTQAGNLKVAMYTDPGPLGSKPGVKMLESASVASGVSGAWQTITVPATYVDNTSWWVAILHGNAALRYKSNSPMGTTSWNAWQNLLSYGDFPADGTLSAVTASPSVLAAHVNYVQVKGFAKATKTTLSTSNALIESVSFYSHSNSGNVRLAIYSDSAGAPGTLLWQSNPTAVSATGWMSINTASGTPTRLVLNSGTYWLAWQWEGVTDGPSYTAGAAGDGNWRAQAYGSFPSTWAGGTSSSETWSMYGSYGIRIGRYDGNWHYLTVARAGTGANQLATYYDGNLVGTATDSRTLTNGDNFYLARDQDGTNYFAGQIDEARLSGSARNANWILAEYRNQANPALFHYNMTEESRQ